MADAGSRGRFVWHDLMTKDSAKAQAFYTQVAGWGTQNWDNSGSPYTMFTANGTPIGGVAEMPPGTPAPPHWIAHITVPDSDVTAKEVASLGGRVIHGPEDVATVGRFTILADPQGAMFSAFTPSSGPDRQDRMPPVGDFSWHELMADDYKTAWTFYQAVFGWDKVVEHDMGPMGVYLIFGRGEHQVGGMFSKSPEMRMPASWLHYIRVDSADRVAELVKRIGGTVMNGPMDVPGGDRIAQCMDPQGGAFAVHSVKAS
jgi:predicted enzyme related to lactoylglutathione lyase